MITVLLQPPTNLSSAFAVVQTDGARILSSIKLGASCTNV